ncbi:MAG: Stk1 family PASTA domain-containing Ser/Thr kinase [Nocardioidaceae bacterium]|nr:Stk1 family PASTA domain-containing Ser/Thr kinase [Nocardioidaceae bacterium]
MIGRVLDGRYQVSSRVARGGMATVYQARDLRLDRTVAVKVMHAGLGDDEEFVARFEREARSAARLSHHNVVAVFDQGDDQGTLFLVMEYVPGLTLRDLIRKEAPMEPGKALGLMEPVLAALAAAHTAGMIHRDVKPENVLLADDGRVKVADFGLARAVNAETQHTATGGVLIGTVSYLSPELVVDGKADARADVYAAGVIVYEMLTGTKPHQADSPIQVAYKHVHEDVPPPSAKVPGLPPYVDALVARATARDRDLRPSDARVLLHQVRRVRQALDHGVVDDPELVDDLLPRAVSPERTDELDLAPVRDEVFDFDATTPVPRVPVVPPTRTATVPPPEPPGPPASPPPALAEPPAPYREKRSRRGLYLLAGVLVAALLVGLGGWYLGVARYTTTPAVINLTESAAKAKITKAGLTFETGKPAYSETVAKGSVIETDPAPGDRVAKDGTVTATISLGPERHEVPLLRGRTVAEATTLLAEQSLSVGSTVQRYDDKVPAGRVIGTDPRQGTPLKRDAAVDLVVSKGRQPIPIGNWTNKPAATAKTRLEAKGFKVSASEQFSDVVAAGYVISQTPNSGTGFKGDTITLVVSKGPELVQIPGVRGMRTKDAKKKLEALGFKVNVEHSALFFGANYVVGVSPGEGNSAPKGSTVTLTIV